MGLRQILKPLVPKPIKLWRQEYLARENLLAALRPVSRRSCPLCEYHGFFAPFGRPPRLDAQCPACGSLERHRLFWLWLAADKRKLAGPLLHFAPEPVLERKFRELYEDYSTASISGSADLNLNIEAIDLPTGSLRTVICNHVLEHVADLRALDEIHRVLSGEGRLVVSVPIVEGWERTYENQDITSSADRALHFGQSDHVRYYGRDFRDRLHHAGFTTIDEVTAEGRNVVDYALLRGEKIFICGKA